MKQITQDDGAEQPKDSDTVSPTILEAFIREIEAYCEATRQAPSSLLGGLGNPTAYKRIKAGGDCATRTVDKARAHMRAHPAPPIATPAEQQACPEQAKNS